jgi:hypothetical protein
MLLRGALAVLAMLGIAVPHAAADSATPAPPSEPVAPAPERRGPIEVRDEHVLAQPRLTLPAATPDTLGKGAFEVRASLLWSNSFAWTQDVPGEEPFDRSFLVDAETRTLDVTLTRGLRDDLDVSLRVPLRWRGGGVMDGLIDFAHRVMGLEGTRDGARPLFLRNAFRVEGRTTEGDSFSWTDETGFGLGDVELGGRFRFHEDSDGWTLALLGRLGVPTGSGPFALDGPSVAGQVLAARSLARPLDIYVGLGATAGDARRVRGVEYSATRAHAFLAFEWRPFRGLSLIAETNGASRLVRNVESYPDGHWLLNFGAKVDVSPRTRLELGFTENIKDQQSTTDFAIFLGLSLRR